MSTSLKNKGDAPKPTWRKASRRTRASKVSARAQAAGTSRQRRRRSNPLARIVNAWWNRLIAAVYQGSLSEQEAQYEEHETTADYLWNSIGLGLWGVTFPALTVIATQLTDTEQAGMLSMAFVGGTLLMIVANYGVRNFQVSDVDEAASFASYQLARWATGALAIVIGLVYCTLRGYQPFMFTISMAVFAYKVIDGLADVYEGRLQQADKLYLAGISQSVRSVLVIAAFSVLLFITRNLAVASVGIAVAAAASLLIVSIPLAFFETERSGPWKVTEIETILRSCFPLFFTLFMFTLIDSVPKFAMEAMLAYDNQLFFNALFFPAQAITITAGFVYKPQLLRLADIWSNPRRRKRFDLIVAAMFAVIAAITLVTGFIMGWIGIPVMSFMYGVDFDQYRLLSYAMVAAGGVNASIDFLYAVIAVLRHQGSVVVPSLVTFACALVIPTVLIFLWGLAGAVWGYLIIMGVLLVLLLVGYVRIRGTISEATRSPFK